MAHLLARRLTPAALLVAAGATLAALDPLPQDRGSTGTWQKLLKLRTIASVLHTTAHPDDEHGGLLAMLSRGEGARVALLTLTRGEAGDNAIGSELFDPLGLIRTDELLRADQYYGVDRQYFTSVIDYGFSKRLEEALVKWGRENVLRDVVHVLRTERPLVVLARFQGTDRDGHGNHQAAGLLTQDAYRVAGDPSVFPEQIRAGLRPWQPLKLYMGGLREGEEWTVRVDPAVYSPWLGDTYANFARAGLAFQRSQNSGRNDPQPGPAFGYYKRLAPPVAPPAKEPSVFDGIDTSVTGIFIALKHAEPANARTLLAAIQREVDAAVSSFTLENPSAVAPALARGLAATRAAMVAFGGDADVGYILRLKEQQFVDAINTALGIDLVAAAQVADPVVRGQTFDVRLQFTNRGSTPIEFIGYSVTAADGSRVVIGDVASPPQAARDRPIAQVVKLTVKPDTALTRPHFTRATIAETRYTILDQASRFSPSAPPAFTATVTYRVGGVPVDVSAPVTRREAQLPYGYVTRELAILPALAVNVSPRQAIVPMSATNKTIRVQVELINNAISGMSGALRLKLPAGWSVAPSSARFTFRRAGEKSRHLFSVTPAALGGGSYAIEAVAEAAPDAEFAEGYDVIEHRDLETRYLYHDAVVRVRGVDVKIAPGLKVGYVMGVGDDVPAGIAQLGAQVQLLDARDLASANLGAFDAIMTGTRAYAVRDDLKTYNTRLLEYVKNGGNLIVLYNTPAEFDPNSFAPFPAQLPRNAEEVSEEDSPVEILTPSRPEFTTPNAITKADFDGWVEQRGSKFFSEWDKAYTPMIATHDQGQPPQRGGWLTATYGKGHYTYFAYAFHRQLPYGVPGAYRLLANLLSLSK